MIVSPSLLAADKNNLPFEAMKMKDAGATYIHIDIMVLFIGQRNGSSMMQETGVVHMITEQQIRGMDD